MVMLNLNRLKIITIVLFLFYSCKKEKVSTKLEIDDFPYPVLFKDFKEENISNSKIYLKNEKVRDSGNFKIISKIPLQALLEFSISKNNLKPKDSIIFFIDGKKQYITGIDMIPVKSNSLGSKPYLIQYNLNGILLSENDEATINKR